MNTAQKLKRIRELLRDSAVREELLHALPTAIDHSAFNAPQAEHVLDALGEAVELAQENVAEATVEKRMNRS